MAPKSGQTVVVTNSREVADLFSRAIDNVRDDARDNPYLAEVQRVLPVGGYRSAIGSVWNAVVDDLRSKIIHRSVELFNTSVPLSRQSATVEGTRFTFPYKAVEPRGWPVRPAANAAATPGKVTIGSWKWRLPAALGPGSAKTPCYAQYLRRKGFAGDKTARSSRTRRQRERGAWLPTRSPARLPETRPDQLRRTGRPPRLFPQRVRHPAQVAR
jgi:hypothetical protein